MDKERIEKIIENYKNKLRNGEVKNFGDNACVWAVLFFAMLLNPSKKEIKMTDEQRKKLYGYLENNEFDKFQKYYDEIEKENKE